MSLVLMDFYAEWCGPCKMMEPIIDELKVKHPEVKIKRIDIDKDTELAEQYGVSAIPCFVLEKDGEEVVREVGMMPLKKLEKMVEKNK